MLIVKYSKLFFSDSLKILFLILIFLIQLYLSHNFKYSSINYNHADSAVYNQVMNSILFRAETGSSLEEGGEKSTFNIHYSPIFYLLAPLKVFYFSEFFPEILQSIIIVISCALLFKIYPGAGVYMYIIIAGILVLPQIIGLGLTSFRTVKLSFPLCLAALHFYKKNNYPLFFLFLILLLSLIETNLSVAAGFCIISLTAKKNIKLSSGIFFFCVLFFFLFIWHVEYSRHIALAKFNISNIINGLIYFLPLFVLFIMRDPKIFLILAPILFFIIFGGVPFFFNFHNISFLPEINCYYTIPVIAFLTAPLIKNIRLAHFKFMNKSIFVIPIFFFALSLLYGIDQKKIFFNFLNTKTNFNFIAVANAKKIIPINAHLNVSNEYSDLFSDYRNLNFFKPFRYEEVLTGILINNIGYSFIDIENTINSMPNRKSGVTNNFSLISNLEKSGALTILYNDGKHVIIKREK